MGLKARRRQRAPEIFLSDRWPLAAIEDVIIATEPRCHGLKFHTHRIILSDDHDLGEGMLSLPSDPLLDAEA